MDAKCSGKPTCEFLVAEFMHPDHDIRPCPIELQAYLQSGYHCISGNTYVNTQKLHIKFTFYILQSFVDTKCSGKGRCQFLIAEPMGPIYGIRPCPLELPPYLEARYTCITGTIIIFTKKIPNDYLQSFVPHVFCHLGLLTRNVQVSVTVGSWYQRRYIKEYVHVQLSCRAI